MLDKRKFLKLAGCLSLSNFIGYSSFSNSKSGGYLRLGLDGANSFDNFDSRKNFNDFMIVAGPGCIFETLTEITPDGKLHGELARDWESSKNARVWTFNLRKEVFFHNGERFDADDVIGSLAIHKRNNPSSSSQLIISSIKEINKISSHQIQFILESGNADLPYLLANPQFIIYPKNNIEVSMKEGIGTGPYKLKIFEPGKKLLADNISDHHFSDRGWFKGIEAHAMNNPIARVNAIRSDLVDTISSVPAVFEKLLSSRSNIKVVHTPSNSHVCFPMRTDKEPFRDNNVRNALKLACNRQKIIDLVLYKQATIGNDHPISPGNFYSSGDINQIKYDPDKASFYLKKSNKSKIEVSLSCSEAAFPGAIQAAYIYKHYAEPAGINIIVNKENPDLYWETIPFTKDWYTSYSSGFPTADWTFSSQFQYGVKNNETKWNNKLFNKLLIKARKELDFSTRKNIYEEMQEICAAQGGTIIPAFYNYVNAYSNKLSHSRAMSNEYNLDDGKICKRWWFNN